MKHNLLSLLLVAAMVMTLLAGCGSTTATNDTNVAADSTTTSESIEAASEIPTEEAVQESEASVEEGSAPEPEPETEGAPAEEPEEPEITISYPLSGDDLNLSLFTSFPGNLTSYMESFDVHPGFQAAQEATGVKITFVAPSMESANQQFELMVASDDFTDIVGGFGDMYVGGATAAYEAELIYDVNPYLAENAPDYLRIINSNENYQDIVYEPDDTMLAVYGLYLYDYTAMSNGIFIRQDWLDDLNLDIPVTYDDWHEVLTAFKNEKNASAALLFPQGGESNGSTYAGGFKVAGYSADARMSGRHLYQVDGKVTSSLIEDAYLDYLTMISQWYDEGIIYHDFYSNDPRDIMDGLIYANETGIFDGKVDYITKFESGDTTGTIRLTGISNPVQNEGEINGFGNYLSAKSSMAIPTTCDKLELALQWLNYFFIDDGILLCNYGQEGVSFEYGADGEPVFTDVILHNEDPQLQFGNVTRLYLLDEVLPTIYDQTRELAAYNDKEQAAIALWSESKEAIYTLPTLTLSTEANEEVSQILVDVETYASESIIKFMIGDKDLSEWSSFTQTMRDMGIERCIEIYQEAYDAQVG